MQVDAEAGPGHAELALLRTVDKVWASGGLRHRLTMSHMLSQRLVTVPSLLRWVLSAGVPGPPVLVSENVFKADAALDVMRQTLQGLVDSVPVRHASLREYRHVVHRLLLCCGSTTLLLFQDSLQQTLQGLVDAVLVRHAAV